MPESSIPGRLFSLAQEIAARSYAPYSGHDSGCVLLLSDGGWIPGVKVECASFPISLPSLNNALTTAVALRRTDIVAIAKSDPFTPEEQAFLENREHDPFHQAAVNVFVLDDGALPPPADAVNPYLPVHGTLPPMEGIRLAREAAARAQVPESAFPVGAVIETRSGRLIPGCNVEYADWSRILCAERNAVSTALSYGERDFRALYLTCLLDAGCSPCGACRQVLVELAPGTELWMDRGDHPPQRITPEELLPGFFSGAGLNRHRHAGGDPRVA